MRLVNYGSHPQDHVRSCPTCRAYDRHVYVASQILTCDTVSVGGDGSDRFCEAAHVTCLSCGTTYSVAGVMRPDVGNDEFGWTFDRRDVGFEDPRPDLLPEFVPPVERGTVRPGALWQVAS
jgi:hypothetical protein